MRILNLKINSRFKLYTYSICGIFNKTMRARGRGITLLEILMAIAIFSFSIIPIIMIYRYLTFTNLKSVNALHAANLALTKLEEYKFGGVITPVNPAAEVKKWGEYERLLELIKEESNPGTDWSPFAPAWKVYERSEDYETIPYFPNFKRYVRISFFPEEKPDPSKYPGGYFSPEYKRLISRIQIFVEVKWAEIEPDRNNAQREKKYTLYTIVTNKVYQ